MWARVWVTVFPVVLAVVLVLAVEPGADGWAVVRDIGVAVFAALLGWRLFQQAVIGTGDGRLVVRNMWRSLALRREDVHEVTVDPANGRRIRGGGWAVWLHLRSGSPVRLDVTHVPFGGPFSGRLEREAEQVRAWLAVGPQPFL